MCIFIWGLRADQVVPTSENPALLAVSRAVTLIRLATLDALDADIEYVHAGVPVQSGRPEDFYRGFDLGWYPISSNLDLRRTLVDTLLLDVVLADETQRPGSQSSM